ncbi:MAG: glutamine--tRNA ligase [Coxiellaceae bacterium]|nr:glutamine--tRNA ligase [Coxiellaceae bacterium]|tara:strand:+ start:4809 stop:6470 length:1662 start_codon:yes stop_codon:yes gene_type:complete
MTENSPTEKTNFIKKIITQDLESGKHTTIVTRFPPEPNGYLHIGHAKSICLNFSLAKEFNGICHLRFDDTNPNKECDSYITAIMDDVRWLGFDWQHHQYHASHYFDIFYEQAVKLIQAGHAYVDDLTPEAMRQMRGTLTEVGKVSPSRSRPIDDSLDLFQRMKAGEFKEGQYTLRAKIDMEAGNINLRDPVIYRIMHTHHHQTQEEWCIYPMYDFAHALSDATEGITHSLCTLEFQDHRPLYDWFIKHCNMPQHPQQIEFSRLNLNFTVTSKRKLKELIDENHVDGWDDPRLPTLTGLRRRGYTPQAIRQFCERIGISKQDSIIDVSQLEQTLREDLNQSAARRMAVLRPLKVTLTNYDKAQEILSISNHPQRPDYGTRDVIFTKTLYIDRDDFMEVPPPKYHRLSPGKEVRLMNAYVIQCDEVIKDDSGHIIELKCRYASETLGGKKPHHGKKVKGIIHWVSADHAIDAEVRLYDRLFSCENPGAEKNLTDSINPESLEVIHTAKLEPSLQKAEPENTFQFNRVGYFCADRYKHTSTQLVFNRSVSLRENWQ